ncbi:hypothetical protein C8N32_108137 [Rhodovulum imhoffii]|uniref:Uncharacterized protein n=1 Tax=Rhodovulum imhoffii TaxID=365340 RepID=A0A2T5BS93_9RHOB|nr:hypothetical protein [Rhodovulum imhoffii]MBK5934761.1 hypothetical protein [Rhodovulum imhoffii]PTN02185.1 hypothetical protein C8N32_108137 [Rhodovulum imhoffii]
MSAPARIAGAAALAPPETFLHVALQRFGSGPAGQARLRAELRLLCGNEASTVLMGALRRVFDLLPPDSPPDIATLTRFILLCAHGAREEALLDGLHLVRPDRLLPAHDAAQQLGLKMLRAMQPPGPRP